MRMLLINSPNRLTRRPEFFPYGLGILASVLKQNRVDVHIYDANLQRDLSAMSHFLETTRPWSIVGISGLITTYGYQRQVAAILRQRLPDALIVSGGGLASAVPELLLATSEIDVACIGEGEDTVARLVASWSGDPDLRAVPGIVWKERSTGDLIRNQPAQPITDLDRLPFPDWKLARLDAYFEYSGFLNKGIQAGRFRRRADLATSRGCPFHCSFCSNVFPRGDVRYRSIQNVIDEIVTLKAAHDIDTIDFLDEDLCCSRRRIEELCWRLIDEDVGIAWGTAARASNVDQELLNLMKRAGCTFLLFGLETGSQSILTRMDKKTTVAQTWEAFARTEEAGIHAHGNMIIGHPGENSHTLTESLQFQMKRYRFLLDLHQDVANDPEFQRDLRKRFSTVSFCTPYPGSPLYEQCKTQIGNLQAFMERITLRDAKDFTVNLTSLPLVELLGWQSLLSDPELWSYCRTNGFLPQSRATAHN